MALAETAELAVRISLKDNVSAGVRGLQKNLGGLNRSLAQTGRGVGQIGAGLTRAGLVVGGAAIAGITGAAKAAIDFQDAFAGVIKTVNQSELDAVGLTFEDLAKQFRTMATEMPIAATELARIGEAAGALGVKATDIEEFTKTVALLGVTTNLTTDEAAESLGKIGTILNLTGKEFENFADILVNLGNKGASTEAEIIEITKRFAASGRQAGLTIPQILAYSSAISSAGAEPESAGSSLSRVFGNLITETARATAKGKAFATVTGKSFKDFSKIVKDDTNGAMLLFLRSLNKLDKFGQQKALKAVGITNVRDRNAILLLAGTIETNLIPAFANAEKATGALGIEAQKRFDTVASKIQVLKNNLIEAGIAVGEGFLPALGRATEKLTAFLKLGENKARLANLGKEIGEAIDSINWQAVLTAADQFVGVLKGALTFAKLMYDAFSALPGPIKEATAGFLVLNKLSGGLLAAGAGNVIGGLAGAAIQGTAARAPGVGSLFAQPVFVTNWAMIAGAGGLGGVGAGAGAAGLAGKIASLIPATLFATALISAAVPIGEAFAAALPKELKGANGAGMSEAQTRILAARAAMGIGPDVVPAAGADRSLIATRPVRPGFVDSPRTSAVDMAAITSAIARGKAAGFSPSFAAAQETVQRNASRAAAHQEQAASRLISSALIQQRAGERLSAVTIPPPNVNVTVNVSPTGIVNKFTQVTRPGPAGSSRETSKRFET